MIQYKLYNNYIMSDLINRLLQKGLTEDQKL